MSKTTPGSLQSTHPVMYHGNYTGDENLYIVEHIAIIDNYIYIDNVNTGIYVKGDTGKSAYESYVEVCESKNITPVSEEEWVEILHTGGGGGTFSQVQSDYAETNTSSVAFIKNKPLSVTQNQDIYDIEFQ